MYRSVTRCGWCAAVILALLFTASAPAAAMLLRQDFGGTVDFAQPGNPFLVTPGPSDRVSGFAVYDGTLLPGGAPPGPSDVPAVQFSLTLGNFTYACFPPDPCMTALGGPAMLSLNPRSGALTGIDVMVPPGPSEFPGGIPPGPADFILFVNANQFVVPPGPNDPPCDASSVVCGTLDFSRSSPRPVPEPKSLALVAGALLALLAVRGQRTAARAAAALCVLLRLLSSRGRLPASLPFRAPVLNPRLS